MEDRQQVILQILDEHTQVSLQDLSNELEVSLVTIRKDVALLEKEGLLIRTRGKVKSTVHNIQNQQPYKLRKSLYQEEKLAIARKAVSLIDDGDSIYLDSGTTTFAIAGLLMNKSHISIATNSICATNLLMDSEHSIFLTGGSVSSRGMCTVGAEAEAYFKKMHARKAFIATTGIRSNLDLTVTLDIEVGIKKAMINSADEIILVVTPDKFSNACLFDFASAIDIDKIITVHPEPPKHILEIIEANHIELIYAD